MQRNTDHRIFKVISKTNAPYFADLLVTKKRCKYEYRKGPQKDNLVYSLNKLLKVNHLCLATSYNNYPVFKTKTCFQQMAGIDNSEEGLAGCGQ